MKAKPQAKSKAKEKAIPKANGAAYESPHERRVRLWMARHPRGIQRRIAEDLGVTGVFVGDVLRKRRNSTDGRVEAYLGKLGAPGFTG
jgi:hypothetical protein